MNITINNTVQIHYKHHSHNKILYPERSQIPNDRCQTQVFLLGAFAKLRKVTVSLTGTFVLPSVLLSFLLSVRPSVCLFVCLSVRPSVWLSVHPFVCLSTWKNSALTEELHEIKRLAIFRKSVGNVQVWLKYDKNNGYFTCWSKYIYNNINNKEIRNFLIRNTI